MIKCLLTELGQVGWQNVWFFINNKDLAALALYNLTLGSIFVCPTLTVHNTIFTWIRAVALIIYIYIFYLTVAYLIRTMYIGEIV